MSRVSSEEFKAAVSPLIERVIKQLGGSATVRPMAKELPEQMVYFVSGGVFSMAAGAITFAPDEVRRMLDLVRLRLEELARGGA